MVDRTRPIHLTVRVDKELLYKLNYVSEYDGRTKSGEILYLIRKYIREFEKENGEIIVELENE